MKTYWMIHSLCGLWAFLSAMLATATWNWINLSECSKCKREREKKREKIIKANKFVQNKNQKKMKQKAIR